jgi:hypothetical protein
MTAPETPPGHELSMHAAGGVRVAAVALNRSDAPEEEEATMPTSKVRPARSIEPAVKVPKSTAVTAKKPAAAKTKTADESPSALIDARIEELGDWRGEMLSRLRAVIKAADPEVTEEWKWRGTPVWSHAGLLCTGETYKSVVKMTFAKGASLADPSRLFNSSLEGNTRRAIDFHEGDKLDEKALKALIRAAVTFNKSSGRG